jgi:hypothetical protein
MLLLIGVIAAAFIIAVLAAEPKETGMTKEQEYCSMECEDVKQHRLNSCC